MNELNICTISDLTEYMFSCGFSKIKIYGLDAIYANSLNALPGKPKFLVKDHRKSKNPYFSRYGYTWVDKLNNSFFMSKLCCISDLIIFMVKEEDKRTKGSVNFI